MLDLRQRIEGLSPRQLQILVYAARHFSSREIGERLELSPATVDSHIAAALQRLGLSSRREAALKLIELGIVPALGDPGSPSVPASSHHGEGLPSNRRQLASMAPPVISGSPGRGPARALRGPGDEPRSYSSRPGMGRVILRCMLDAFYIILFFAAMSAGAFGVHRIVVECEQSAIDPFALLVLKWVSYALVVLDGVGVVTATGLLTYRFVRAIMRVED